MTVRELIKKLEALPEEQKDWDVFYQTHDERLGPESVGRNVQKKAIVILLKDWFSRLNDL